MSERGRVMARGTAMLRGGGGTKKGREGGRGIGGGSSRAPVLERDRPSEEGRGGWVASACLCGGVLRRGCRWHRAGAGPAHCPLAVPGSICHQQEHLQPKVPLSPSVRVTSLAFPLV